MTPDAPPDGPQPQTLEQACWDELGLALTVRGHGWRSPVLATVDAHGQPQARTVILREIDPAHARLTVYSDARAPKVAQLQRQPAASLVFWCAQRAWQLRIRGQVSLILNGPEHAQRVHRLGTSPSARDYLSMLAPGRPLGAPASPHAGDASEADPLPPPQLHLAILRIRILEADWLHLHAGGHRRMRFAPGQTATAIQP